MLNKNKVKLGIAPIAWTNDDMPDLGKENTFEQCVSEMALAGFTGSEVGGKISYRYCCFKKGFRYEKYRYMQSMVFFIFNFKTI